MQPFADALQANAGVLALFAMVAAILALLMAWLAVRRADRTAHEHVDVPTVVNDAALDQILTTITGRLDGLDGDLGTLGGRTQSIEVNARRAVQSVGLVRFNPFEDTGSNQSFALAFLDGEDNGIILSSLHSRQATRVYVKAIVAGHCNSPMSAEEAEALRQARVGGGPA